jgi:hypothetical protein
MRRKTLRKASKSFPDLSNFGMAGLLRWDVGAPGAIPDSFAATL